MRGFDGLETTQEQINGFQALHNHVLSQPRLGGRAPAEAAGMPTPVLANEGRLMAVLAAAYELQVQEGDEAPCLSGVAIAFLSVLCVLKVDLPE